MKISDLGDLHAFMAYFRRGFRKNQDELHRGITYRVIGGEIPEFHIGNDPHTNTVSAVALIFRQAMLDSLSGSRIEGRENGDNAIYLRSSSGISTTIDRALLFYIVLPRIRKMAERLGIEVTREDTSFSFVWKKGPWAMSSKEFRPIREGPVADLDPFLRFERQDKHLDGRLAFRGGTLRVDKALLERHRIPADGITAFFPEDAVWVLLAYLYTRDASLAYISLPGVLRIKDVEDLARIFELPDLTAACHNYRIKECPKVDPRLLVEILDPEVGA